MTISLYVEEHILTNFHKFVQGIDEETNGTIIRRCWHLRREVNGPLVKVTVDYDDYIRLADNE